MNDQSRKKRIYFNLIDVILIVLVLAAVISLVFLLKNNRVTVGSDKTTEEIVYRIEFSPLREELRNFAEVGNTVVLTESLKAIGEITDVSYTSCHYVGTNKATGASVSSPYPEHITMVLTVKATAIKTDTGYTLSGRELILGESLSIRLPNFTGSGRLLSVEKKTVAPTDQADS